MFSAPTIKFNYAIEIILLVFGILLLIVCRVYLKCCSPKMKEIIVESMIILVIVIMVLFILEGTTRIFFPQKTLKKLGSFAPQVFEKGEDISWVHKPNAASRMINGEVDVGYTINSMGMRDIERNITKNKNIKRILVLGDSMTEGFGVEQNKTYPYQLERILNEKDIKVEVWNAGVTGYSPDTEFLYLKNMMSEVKPDVVLVGFYAGNDVIDISKNRWVTDEKDLPMSIESKIMYVKDNVLKLNDDNKNPYILPFFGYINLILLRYSHFYIFLKNNLICGDAGSLEGIMLMTKDKSPEILRDWEKTKELMGAMDNLSRLNNASFVVVIIPARVQVNDKEWNYVEKRYIKSSPKRDAVQQELLMWCNEMNVKCIDLLPEFLVMKEGLYYTLMDIHLNELGHLRTAQVIAEKIQLS